MGMRVTIQTEKGGVGKTTIATNLAAGLAREGFHVLAIDTDQQAHLTWTLLEGIPEYTIKDLFQRVPVGKIICKSVEENLDVIPSCKAFASIEQEIGNKIARDSILNKAIAPIIDNYDFIIIDTQPSVGVLSVNTLCAADEVIIPIDDAYSLEALYHTISVIDLVREELNPNLRIGGIVLNKFNPRTKLAKEIRIKLREDFKDLLFDTTIPQNVKLAECPSHNMSIFEYAPESTGAVAYKKLTKECMKRWGMI